MERKLGINSDCLKGVPSVEALALIKETGFDSHFTGEYRPAQVEAIKKESDRLGLIYEFIHAPFKGINDMWMPGVSSWESFNKMKLSIDAAAANDIPVVVAHVSSGWKCPEITDLGLARFDALVEYAEKKGVKIAFENLRRTGNLAYLVDRYEDLDCVGFCYDFGHGHCYTKTVCWPDIFCHKLLVTHIHDNNGRGWEKEPVTPDLHLLPFDGNINYEPIMRKLDEYEFDGILTLEVGNTRRPEYAALSHQAFLSTCYERLLKISKM